MHQDFVVVMPTPQDPPIQLTACNDSPSFSIISMVALTVPPVAKRSSTMRTDGNLCMQRESTRALRSQQANSTWYLLCLRTGVTEFQKRRHIQHESHALPTIIRVSVGCTTILLIAYYKYCHSIAGWYHGMLYACNVIHGKRVQRTKTCCA